MADERTLFAGDLTTDQIGRKIRIQATPTTTVEDVLTQVLHHKDASALVSLRTTVWFRDTRYTLGILISDQGVTVPHTEKVVVL